jgi:HlyD family secretion protein
MNADVQVEIATRPNALVVPNAAVVGIRDAVPAGAVLGISEDRMQTALRGQAPTQLAMAASSEATPGSCDRRDAGRTRRCSVRRVSRTLPEDARRRPGSLSEADRTRLAACRPAGSGDAQQLRGSRTGGASGGADAAGARGARTTAGPDARPGVVFVAGQNGPEPRRVMLGVNDWDNTEILSGIEPGESVVLISVARLQQQQAEFQQRMRERMGGGPIPGGGPVRR